MCVSVFLCLEEGVAIRLSDSLKWPRLRCLIKQITERHSKAPLIYVCISVITPPPSSPPCFHSFQLIHDTWSAPSLVSCNRRDADVKFTAGDSEGIGVWSSLTISSHEVNLISSPLKGHPTLQCRLASTRMNKCAVCDDVLLVSLQSLPWLCMCVVDAFFYARDLPLNWAELMISWFYATCTYRRPKALWVLGYRTGLPEHVMWPLNGAIQGSGRYLFKEPC